MTLINLLNSASFYLASILVVFSAIVYLVMQKKVSKPQNKIFLILLAVMMIQGVAKIGTIYHIALAATSPRSVTLARFAMFLYQFLHMLMPPLLLYYSLYVTRTVRRFSNLIHGMIIMPFFLSIVMLSMNPGNSMLYSFYDDYRIHMHWGEYLCYGIGLLYLFLMLMVFKLWWHAFTQQRWRILLFSFSMVLVGVFIRLLVPILEVELFFEALAFLGILLAVEYDDERMDVSTGIYNRAAFLQDLRTFLEIKSRIYVITIRFENLDLVKRFFSMSDDELLGQLVKILKGASPDGLIYRVTPSGFTYIIQNDNRDAANYLAERIQRELRDKWLANNKEIPLRTIILFAAVPRELQSIDDVLLMCESEMPESAGNMILSGRSLLFLMDRSKTDEALHRGIRDNNFRMEYQLMYTGDTHEVYAAESFLRLYDPELGEVSPADFIPMAEKNGLIDVLGDYVLKKVCEFLKSPLPERMGIRFVSVNLSIVQCMNPDFIYKVKSVVDSYGVAHEMINFEVTETSVDNDFDVLKKTISELKKEGFLFSIQGYGSGYSNMYSVFSLDFDMIKMDRTLLSDDSNSRSYVVLEHNVKMIREMDKRVIIMGIENKEQMERTKSLDVDYLQGYYFSKPWSEEELFRGEIV